METHAGENFRKEASLDAKRKMAQRGLKAIKKECRKVENRPFKTAEEALGFAVYIAKRPSIFDYLGDAHQGVNIGGINVSVVEDIWKRPGEEGYRRISGDLDSTSKRGQLLNSSLRPLDKGSLTRLTRKKIIQEFKTAIKRK